MELKLYLENGNDFVNETLVKMKNLGADVKCNKQGKTKYVNETITTENEMNIILSKITDLEGKAGQDPSVHIELMKAYQKVCLFLNYFILLGG